MEEQGERNEAEQELAFVTAAIRATVSRLLREDEASPRLVARLLAKVAGELGAAAALASGTEVEAVLDQLAEVVLDRPASATHELHRKH